MLNELKTDSTILDGRHPQVLPAAGHFNVPSLTTIPNTSTLKRHSRQTAQPSKAGPNLRSLSPDSIAALPWSLLQVRAHDVDEFVGGQGLLRADLLLGIDDMKTDVSFQQFCHQSVHGTTSGGDQLQ